MTKMALIGGPSLLARVVHFFIGDKRETAEAGIEYPPNGFGLEEKSWR